MANKYVKKKYIVITKKRKNDLFILLPNEIVKAFDIKVGDIAVFETINNKKFSIRFIKNTMYSLVEKIKIKSGKK